MAVELLAKKRKRLFLDQDIFAGEGMGNGFIVQVTSCFFVDMWGVEGPLIGGGRELIPDGSINTTFLGKVNTAICN